MPEASGNTHARQPWPLKENNHGPQSSAYFPFCWHWSCSLLFGGGRVSGLMGDVAKGIKSFKKGLADDDETHKPAAKIEAQSTRP